MHYKINDGIIESELAAKSTRQPNKQVLKYINTLSSDEVVLDYGCGKLRYTIPLSKQVKKVVAIDSLEQLSKRQIINGKMMRLLDFYDEAISIYSIDSVEWRNQQYDTIFCTNVLSAVPYYIERLQILKNAKSVLKDSGVLFISTQYRNSYFNTYNCSATRFLRNRDRIVEKKSPILRSISEARSLASTAPQQGERPTQEGGLF